MSFTSRHLEETIKIAGLIDAKKVEEIIDKLLDLKKENGRIFFVGVGGSAANASHAVNDFRKLADIESYAPTDNIAELTARTNDEGWSTVFVEWLRTSRMDSKDCLFVLSVGGGNRDQNVSVNICESIEFAHNLGAFVTGIVGKRDSHLSKYSKSYLEVPIVNPNSITPHAESFQEIIWHLMVSHPKLAVNKTKW
jgi:D-sedoheptulose 7-phosphate isomerase